MPVLPSDVLAFLGRSGEGGDDAQMTAHIATTTAMVRAYVRDRGFDPDTDEPADDLAAVIVSCTARQYSNPTGEISSTVSVDDGSVTKTPGIFRGWTLPELAVLHRYRARAQ